MLRLTTWASDLDILCHYLAPGGPTRISSFGSLQHFRKVNKPTAAGEAKRCLDCAHERDCAYSAKKGTRPGCEAFSYHRADGQYSLP